MLAIWGSPVKPPTKIIIKIFKCFKQIQLFEIAKH